MASRPLKVQVAHSEVVGILGNLGAKSQEKIDRFTGYLPYIEVPRFKSIYQKWGMQLEKAA
jgi:hypothetical protein